MPEHDNPFDRVAEQHSPDRDFQLRVYLGVMGVYTARVGALAASSPATR